jgi:hypothetical protein
MISMFALLACENSEIQKSITDKVMIEQRQPNCDNCPVEDCCCRVALNGSSAAALTFCGTTNPELSSSHCSVDLVDCNDISGYYWTHNLFTPGNTDEYFCVAKNSSFMIGVGTVGANLTLTCQVGQANPQVINLSLGAGEKFYYTADGDCELTACHVE